jgi:carboxyl-terminal processing protease
MVWNKMINRLLWIIIACSISFTGYSQELLKESEINPFMKQVFQSHVDKREMSKEILKHSFKVYIDQFDPEKAYLLQSEIEPFINPTDEQISTYLDQYQKGDFSAFDKLNDLIAKSIDRAREIRMQLEADSPALFNEAEQLHYSKADEYNDKLSTVDFANNVDELKARIAHQMAQFIRDEMHQYGAAVVMHKQQQVVDFYNKQMAVIENRYLFVDLNGKPLEASERENMLTLHILKALTGSLDSHTTFFDQNEANEMKVQLEKELHGIGVVLQQGIEGVIITQLVEGGPAAKSGQLKLKDEITAIDGKSIVGEPLMRVMELMRGKDGSTVNLTIKRGQDQVFNVELKRSPIVLDNDRVDISFVKFGNGIIGKLTLHSFYQGDNGVSSEVDLRNAIDKLKKEGNLRGLILDLRDNGGGFLTQAVKVSSLFMNDGVVVVSKYFNGQEQFYRDISGKRIFDGPLIILTSKVTASAAEIVAETLQDYGLALIVGDDRTFGKGSIQSQTVTNGGTASPFKVTVGKYYTVSGKSPQLIGVQADIVVPGPLNFVPIGEKYSETPLTSDSITPAYNDSLKDIDLKYRPWFLKYYIPNLQHPVTEWRDMVPTLKKNSEYRIANNKDYQLFLQKIQGKDDEKASEESPVDVLAKNYGKEDLQMNEAVNIMKDMLTLHPIWASETTKSQAKSDH